MAEYIVTSGSHTVTKDGTPLGGSPYASDVAALQAAHDDGVTDDVIKLAQNDANTKFELGAAEQLLMSKGMPIEGIVDAGVTPAVTGGKRAIEFNGVGENASFKNLKLEDGLQFGLYVKKAANVTVEDVEVTVDTSKDRQGDNPDPVFLGMLVGNAPVWGVSDGDITGTVSVKRYKSNMERDSDDEDPYAGELQKINPAPIANGGAWPGAGSENPDGWKSFSALIGTAKGKVTISDCEVKNHSVHGITTQDNLQEVEVYGNKESSWYGIHINGVSSGGTGFMLSNGDDTTGLIDAAYQARHGSFSAHDNEIEILGRTRAGVFNILWNGGPSRPHMLSIYRNYIKAAGAPAQIGIMGFGYDRAFITKNVLEGIGIIGFLLGFDDPNGLGVWGTRNPIVVGNDLSAWTSFFVNYLVYGDVQNAFLNPPGSNLDLGYQTKQFGAV